ncbi:MAG: hypothetical protein MJ072_03440, partial [Clostridia bacterium]|nr:hypothetical protein [Clostridia bacterium]
EDLLTTSTVAIEYFDAHYKCGLGYAVEHNGVMDRSILVPAFNELSEISAIYNDSVKQLKEEQTKYNADLQAHKDAEPWIFAKWFNTKRYQKWQAQGKEMVDRFNKVSTMESNVNIIENLQKSYVENLMKSGVSGQTVQECISNANKDVTVSEDTIYQEIGNCDRTFDQQLKTLENTNQKSEIARILAERDNCAEKIRELRTVNPNFTQEELDSLYLLE